MYRTIWCALGGALLCLFAGLAQAQTPLPSVNGSTVIDQCHLPGTQQFQNCTVGQIGAWVAGGSGGPGATVTLGNVVLPDARKNLNVASMVDVTSYDADPSGATFSTNAINAAMAANVNSTFYFPPGTFKVAGAAISILNNVEWRCASRDNTTILIDDPTGLLDGIIQTAHHGGFTISDCNVQRNQAAIGSLNATFAGEVVAVGSSNAINDILTTVGGTCTSQPTVKVTSVSGGATTGIATQNAGACTAPPPEPVVTTSSGSGAGTTLRLNFVGPALIHFTDSYFNRVLNSRVGGTNSWNGIGIDCSANSPNQIYIMGNQMFAGAYDAINVNCQTNSLYAADVYIDGRNYILNWGHAGANFQGNLNGMFAHGNTITGNAYGLFLDTQGYTANIGSSTFNDNDLDGNTVRQAQFYGLTASTFQLNHIFSGPGVECVLCINIASGKNHYEASTARLILTGVTAYSEVGSHWAGMTTPVTIQASGSTASTAVNLTGSTWYGGSGAFATLSGAPSRITLGLESNTGNAVYTGTGSNVTVLLNTGLQLIQTLTAANSAELDFTTSLPNAKTLRFVCNGVFPATTGATLQMQFSEDGGSTYKISGYQYGGSLVDTSGTQTLLGQTNDSGIYLGTGHNARVSRYAIEVADINHTYSQRDYSVIGTVWNSVPTLLSLRVDGSYTGDSNIINAERFRFTSGNMTLGDCSQYAYQN